MAASEQTSNTASGSQAVGKVVILYGTVKAIAPDGSERILALNSPVFADENIVTESDGRVSIILNDAAETHLDIGRMSTVVLDQDVVGGVTADEIADATAEVEQIQEALLAEGFDPTVELEAPAAGSTSSAGGGHPVPEFARVTHEGEVTSGAETVGIVTDTVDPIPGSAEPPAPSINVQMNAEGSEVPEGDDAVFTVTITDAVGGSQLDLQLITGSADSPSDFNV
ncbi:MAG: retention module-containing protein [Nitrospiraceae bacterium]|nr:MAG: retention module-containing protein [Nitrospiraceae bacterium]